MGVTNVKTVIDGMRSTRDTQMSEMAQLKAQVKEQNQRLIILSQEKAKLDSKTKQNQAADAASLEQTQAAFSNKQVSNLYSIYCSILLIFFFTDYNKPIEGQTGKLKTRN